MRFRSYDKSHFLLDIINSEWPFADLVLLFRRCPIQYSKKISLNLLLTNWGKILTTTVYDKYQWFKIKSVATNATFWFVRRASIEIHECNYFVWWVNSLFMILYLSAFDCKGKKSRIMTYNTYVFVRRIFNLLSLRLLSINEPGTILLPISQSRDLLFLHFRILKRSFSIAFL